MTRTGATVRIAVPALLIAVVATRTVFAQAVRENPSEFQKVNVVEHLGDTIPLDLAFVDESGNTVRLGDYLQPGRPVIVDLAYYRCPMLCNLVFNGLAVNAISIPDNVLRGGVKRKGVKKLP